MVSMTMVSNGYIIFYFCPSWKIPFLFLEIAKVKLCSLVISGKMIEIQFGGDLVSRFSGFFFFFFFFFLEGNGGKNY